MWGIKAMTMEDVKTLLQSWVAGNIDSYEWDAFISIKSNNSKLETIRSECEAIWVKGSPYIENSHQISLTLNDAGIKKVQEIIAEIDDET